MDYYSFTDPEGIEGGPRKDKNRNLCSRQLLAATVTVKIKKN